jgi:hypothetical protein
MDRDGDSIRDSRHLLFSRVDSESAQRVIFILNLYKNNKNMFTFVLNPSLDTPPPAANAALE